MKKRILAIAMALIMLTGTSPLTVDASEIFNEPASDVETLADAPKDEPVVVEVQAVVNETAEPKAVPAADASATITNEPASDAIVNPETTTPASKSVATPAPDGDKPADAPAPKEEQEPKKAPVQGEPEKEAEQKTPVTPSDAQEEAEEPVEDVVEIEEKETPLAGPLASNVLSFYNDVTIGEVKDKGVFQFTDDYTNVGWFEESIQIHGQTSQIVYVLPNTTFSVKRQRSGGISTNGGWWRWADGSDYSKIDALVKRNDVDDTGEGDKYVIGKNEDSESLWAGGTKDNKFETVVNVLDASAGVKATLRMRRGFAQTKSKNIKYKGREGLYKEISRGPVTGYDEVEITICVAEVSQVRYHLNDSTGNVLQLNSQLGITYGYTTGNDDTSLWMSITEQIPQRENYQFLGWSEEPGATKATYTAGEQKAFRSSINGKDLYAVWAPKYTVNYFKCDDITKIDSVDLKNPDKVDNDGYGKTEDDIPFDKANTSYENAGYRFAETKGDLKIKEDGTAVLNVFYVNHANYKVEYYKDAILVEEIDGYDPLVPGDIGYEEDRYFGYKYDGIEGDQKIKVDGTAVLKVKYKKNSGKLTIKTGNGNVTSIFKITGNGISMEVAVKGELVINSLPLGTYQVAQVGGWNWDCGGNLGERNPVVTVDDAAVADFGSLSKKSGGWYGAETAKDNIFNAILKKQEGGEAANE